MSKDETHYKATYVTADGRHAFSTRIPYGLMAPPHFDLHAAGVGTVRFYWAECYPSIIVDPQAKTRAWPE